MEKAEKAIKFIRSFATIAEKNGEVVEVAYSGGKDSDVLLHLVRASGIKYVARYKSTTIDPVGTIKHVQEQGDVNILRPKQSFFEIVKECGMPNRHRRICCKYLKEYPTESNYVLIGVRAEESKKRRARYTEPTQCRVFSKTKKVKQGFPILYWTLEDVKEYVEENNIKLAPVYEDNRGGYDYTRRLGCVICPLKSKNKLLEVYRRYPRYTTLVLRAKYAYYGGFYDKRGFSIYDTLLMDLQVAMKEQLTERALFEREDSKSVIERLLGIEIDENEIRSRSTSRR